MGIKIIDLRVDLSDLYRILRDGKYADGWKPGLYTRETPPIYEETFKGSLRVRVWFMGFNYVSAGEESHYTEDETFAVSVDGILDPDGRPIPPLKVNWGYHWFSDKDDVLKSLRKEILSIAETEGINVIFF